MFHVSLLIVLSKNKKITHKTSRRIIIVSFLLKDLFGNSVILPSPEVPLKILFKHSPVGGKNEYSKSYVSEMTEIFKCLKNSIVTKISDSILLRCYFHKH